MKERCKIEVNTGTLQRNYIIEPSSYDKAAQFKKMLNKTRKNKK